MLLKSTWSSNIVGVDFDGTLSMDGNTLCKKAAKYIPKIHNLGVDLVLWTCRCDDRYEEAKSKILEWGLPIKFVEDCVDNKPRKLFCIYTIDDRSVPGGKINWYKTFKYIRKLKSKEW